MNANGGYLHEIIEDQRTLASGSRFGDSFRMLGATGRRARVDEPSIAPESINAVARARKQFGPSDPPVQAMLVTHLQTRHTRLSTRLLAAFATVSIALRQQFWARFGSLSTRRQRVMTGWRASGDPLLIHSSLRSGASV